MPEKIPEAKLAWFAAVLDLHGMFTVKDNKMRATPQYVLTVQSVNLAVVQEMARLVGTSPEPQVGRKRKEFMRRGCKEHCPEAHVHMEDVPLPPMGKFTLTGVAAAIILDAVIPYMITDRGMAALRDVIFAQAKLSGQGSGATRAAVQRVEALGWPIPEHVARRMAEPTYGTSVLRAGQASAGLATVPKAAGLPTDERGRYAGQ